MSFFSSNLLRKERKASKTLQISLLMLEVNKSNSITIITFSSIQQSKKRFVSLEEILSIPTIWL
jgi:hypothetical protein